MTNCKFISVVILSMYALATISCNHGKQAEHGSHEEALPGDVVELRADQAKLAQIETGAIEMRQLNGTLKVSGMVSVAPQNIATVCMPLGGFIKSTALTPGNAVKKGQILAIVENQEFVDIQQQYLEASNKFEYAEAEYKRHNELYKDDVYSQKNLQQVTADYKNLKALVKSLEQKLTLIGINPAKLHEDDISSSVAVVSPIAGYVKTINVNLGKYVAPSDVLFEIINSDKLLLELTLFEKDAEKVSAGQGIRFYINNETEQHGAVIYQTSKSINTDRSYKVYASVTGPCKNILPGMYVNAVIETSGNKVSALPSDAIVSFDDKHYIFVFDKHKEENGQPFTEYRMVEIRTGVTDGGYTEVFLPQGFDTGVSKIVIKGAYHLLSAKKNAGEMSC